MESKLLNAVNYVKNISKKKVTFAQTSLSPESINDGTEYIEENYIQQNKKKDSATMETFKNDPSATDEKLDRICAVIKKIKEFQSIAEIKFTKLELTYTTLAQPVELNTFKEGDMTLRQSERMDTANKPVDISSQQQQCSWMGAGNKGD